MELAPIKDTTMDHNSLLNTVEISFSTGGKDPKLKSASRSLFLLDLPVYQSFIMLLQLMIIYTHRRKVNKRI